ncbi:MAG: arginine--tRNA ligase [Cytophagales bacterium]|nr:arginine--tRNA ligase [Cytophagales bacterium]
MDLNKILIKQIATSFKKLFDLNLKEAAISLQPTTKEFEGDFTFVTFPFSKITKCSPQDTAKKIGEYIKQHTNEVADFNVVKGFLNIIISDEAWVNVFNKISVRWKPRGIRGRHLKPHKGGKRDGEVPPLGRTMSSGHRASIAGGRGAVRGAKIMVEYSSPNTNKPLHLGHLRNNFLGFSVCEILKANGYEVIKTNLINDKGIHICKSMLAYQKFGNSETPESTGIKGDRLVGDYYVKFEKAYQEQILQLKSKGVGDEATQKEAPLMVEAREMLHKWEKGDKTVRKLWKTMNDWVYKGFDATYKSIGVDFDKLYYESDTYLLGKEIVEQGLKDGLFLVQDDGSVWVDLTGDGLDDKLLLRADGTSVYITQDLGTADLKYKDHKMQRSVYVVGNEQDHHFDVLKKILKKLNKPYAEGIYHLSYGMVDLPAGKMKSREGTVVDADDLVAEMIAIAEKHTKELGKIEGFTKADAKQLYRVLALGALKFFLLKVDPKKRMLFNTKESIDFQGFTGPFVQYTYARISSILRKAKEKFSRKDAKLFDFFSLRPLSRVLGKKHSLHQTEREVIILLSRFPDRIKEAGEAYSPAIIAQYVYDLAKTYNRFYVEVPVLSEKNHDTLFFRIIFSYIVAQTIKRAMALLGIEVPERM